MDEETAVGNGVCSCGSPAYTAGTYVYDGSCCKFMCININSLSSSCLQKGQARWVYINALFNLYLHLQSRGDFLTSM